MSPTPIDQLIELRLAQAVESLEEAQILLKAGLLRGAVNRAYYAMFYAVMALAVQRQEVTSKHSGAIAFFDREFVKSGLFPKDLSRSIHLAFQRRQETDYGDVFLVDEDEATQLLVQAHNFVNRVGEYLRTIQG